MVDVSGHLGMALIWLAPAWFFLDREKTAALFVGVGVWFGMLPDVDLLLSSWFQEIKHHGIFHTVLVVTLIAAVVGPVVGWVLRRLLGGSDWFSPQAANNATGFGFLMVWIAGLGHLSADILSAPDIADSIEPFWPVYQQSLGIDIVWYNSPLANWGLLAAGILLNLALWAWKRRTGERTTHATA